MRVKTSILIKCFLLSLCLVTAFALPKTTFAAWDPNNLISDQEMTNSGTMSEQQIQDFLVAHGSFMAIYAVPEGRYMTWKGVSYYETPWIGPAGAEVNATGWRAAKVIYEASRWYGINPQVIIATMQKESSLITSYPPAYYGLVQWAMGYAYTESGIRPVCKTSTNYNPTGSCAGFAVQVDWAATSLSNSTRNANNHSGNGYGCDFNGNGEIDWDLGEWAGNYWTNAPFRLCDGDWVTAQTGATAALYRYTPHYAGGYSFYTIYTGWFENWDLIATSRLKTGQNMWNASATKFMVSGDFNKDTYDDVAAMYDYGNGKMGIWSFQSNGTSFVPKLMYIGSNNMWNMSATKFVVSGDFNNDGYDDVAAVYDYGNGKIGVWDFQSTGLTLAPKLLYMGEVGNWNTAATKSVVAGDFNKDGYDDIAAMYDYGSGKMGIWSFQSNGTKLTPVAIYTGANGNWDMSATRFVAAGDHNNDGTDDITAMYDYGNGKMGFWGFISNGNQLAPKKTFMSSAWYISQTKFLVSGKFDITKKEGLVADYDYSRGDYGLWNFVYQY